MRNDFQRQAICSIHSRPSLPRRQVPDPIPNYPLSEDMPRCYSSHTGLKVVCNRVESHENMCISGTPETS